ncbi:MAG: hypothetical protein ABGY41_15505, partial [Candidatus Poribacteria bacterium]
GCVEISLAGRGLIRKFAAVAALALAVGAGCMAQDSGRLDPEASASPLPTPRALWNDETDQVLDSTDASRAEEDPHVLAERRASMQAWVQYARALFSAAEFRFID